MLCVGCQERYITSETFDFVPKKLTVEQKLGGEQKLKNVGCFDTKCRSMEVEK